MDARVMRLKQINIEEELRKMLEALRLACEGYERINQIFCEMLREDAALWERYVLFLNEKGITELYPELAETEPETVLTEAEPEPEKEPESEKETRVL